MNRQDRDTLGKIALAVLLVVGTIGAFVGGPLPMIIVVIALVVLYWVVWKS